jgi:hypothetical protein
MKNPITERLRYEAVSRNMLIRRRFVMSRWRWMLSVNIPLRGGKERLRSGWLDSEEAVLQWLDGFDKATRRIAGRIIKRRGS